MIDFRAKEDTKKNSTGERIYGMQREHFLNLKKRNYFSKGVHGFDGKVER